MRTLKINLSLSLMLLCIALSASACGDIWSSRATISGNTAYTLSPAAPIASDDTTTERTIRFLEDKVRRDPEDFSAHNKLAGYYHQRLRETGDLNYLELTFRAARASLASVPVVRNAGGLAALTQAEYASHEFTSARDHAKQLTELDPAKAYPYLMLGDALLELGDYEQAANAFRRAEQVSDGINDATETRAARISQLRGDNAGAARHYSTALKFALHLSAPPRETVAWSRWQAGETAFSIGNYQTAEQSYRDALVTFPNYYRALASMGRVRAAQNDLQGGIAYYEQAVQRLPDPSFVAALGDLYKLAGRDKDAEAQYRLVEQIGHLSAVNGALYNRQLALFYADHDLKPAEAYENAVKEYEVRRDIYGADAVAWTALKADKISEAQRALKEALRLGTQDARLFYHAGMILGAAGDKDKARDYLQRALKLNPQFDPLQAQIARRSLEN